MKDEYKILIGAIVVILLVLVGAFALSGSNNSGAKATPTPTVAPANNPTATATATPGGNGGNGGTPSATPTATPTVTPVPPTPTPESGVKLTEFGYWITYPPLPPQNWSEYKRPNQTGWNTVYFDPTSRDVITPIYMGPQASEEPSGEPAVIHRHGDLSGTVTVEVNVVPSDNMVEAGSLTGGYYIPTMPNMTWKDFNHTSFNLTFGPNVTEQIVYIYIAGAYDIKPRAAAEGNSFQGTVKLDIVNVDGGYHIGSNEFTLNVRGGASVSFSGYNEGYLWEGEGYDSSGNIQIVDEDDSTVYVAVSVYSSSYFDTAKTISFTGSPLPADAFTFEPCTFQTSDLEKQLVVGINKDYIVDGDSLRIDIADNGNYLIGYPSYFYIYFGMPGKL